jgi:uncharacterized protein YbdZ (MbtH family)
LSWRWSAQHDPGVDIVVQWVRTSWTKRSRGGVAATRRNAVPVGFELPAVSPPLVHEVVMGEHDDFQPRSSLSHELPDAAAGVLVRALHRAPLAAAAQDAGHLPIGGDRLGRARGPAVVLPPTGPQAALALVSRRGTGLGLMNLCFYLALARIPLGIAVTIEFLGPLAVALAGSRRWLDAFWAVLAAGGVVLLMEGRGDLNLVGFLFALAAGTCWGLYILVGAALGRHTTEGNGLALGMAVAALVAVPFGVADSGTALIQPWVLVAGLAAVLLSSVIPYHGEQYSVWPAGRDVPAGWTTVGDPAPKSDCLDRIDRMWTDMRPLSLRAAHRTEVPN